MTLTTAGVGSSYTISIKDQCVNQRTVSGANEYDLYARIIPDDAATNLVSGTVKASSIVVGTPLGTHKVSYTVTRAGTHNLLSSAAFGQYPPPGCVRSRCDVL